MASYTLITGASSGIGWATAQALAAMGKDLILVSRNKEKLEDLKEQLSKFKGVVEIHACDVRDTQKMSELLKTYETSEIAAIVNNAGLALGKSPLEEEEPENWDTVIDTNVKGSLNLLKYGIPLLKKSKGYLINVTSIAAYQPYAGGAVYTASKHALKAISGSIREELLGTGVRITDIAPGLVATNFTNVRFKNDARVFDETYKGVNPLVADDIAQIISWCLSQPKHVNIQELIVTPTNQLNASKVHRE